MPQFGILREVDSLELVYIENPFDSSQYPKEFYIEGPIKDSIIKMNAEMPSDFSSIIVKVNYEGELYRVHFRCYKSSREL